MSKYTIEVSFTPLCPSCSDELHVSLTESKASSGPFERDNPYERKDRRAFVHPCLKCYVFKNEAEPAADVSALG